MSGDEDVLKKSSSGGSLCGLMNLFKRAHDEEKEEEEKITRLKMEENTEAEKLKEELCLKQDQIKSSSSSSSSMISLQLGDLLDELASLKGTLQSLARDVAELKAETLYYSGRVNYDHTHFTSPPMTSSLYNRGDVANKSRLFDEDYYTSCQYADSHHPDEYQYHTAK